MRFRITLKDGTTQDVEADYWVQDQPDGPSWEHYHGSDEVCNELCRPEGANA